MVELSHRDQAPKFEKENNLLVYKGNNSTERDFFKQYKILDFFQAFPDSKRERTLNVFTFVSKDKDFIYDIKEVFPNKYLKVEDISGIKVELANSYPNDYGTTSPVVNLGAAINLKNFDYINVPKAWDYTFGSSDVLIGISDTKIDTTHVDFMYKTNFLQGYYDAGMHTLPYISGDTYNYHGTTVAYIAAAQGNNGNTATGVCSNCSIIANYLKYGNPGDYTNPTPNFNNLLQLAIAGARVINMSWIWENENFDPNHSFYQWVIDEIYEDYNVVLVAAAGNRNPFKYPQYEAYNYMYYNFPASYNHVISVSTVHHQNSWGEEIVNLPNYGDVTRFAEDMIAPSVIMNYQGNGPYAFRDSSSHTTNDKVDICAPHYSFLASRYIGENAIIYAGATSTATPHVTGTVGLMVSLNPCLINYEIEAVLKLTSKNLERIPGNEPYFGRIGSGKLEVGDALEFVYEMMSPNGNAIIDDQYFYRFNFQLNHINNKLTIRNQVFKDESIANFTAKNEILVLPDTDLKPNNLGYVDLKIDDNIVVDCNYEPRVFNRDFENKNIIQKSNLVKLSPNPNYGHFEVITDFEGIINLEIYDLYGKEVYKQQQIGTSIFTINCSHLTSGVYIVKITNNQLTEIIKFIKH